MSKEQESLKTEIYGLLKSRGFNPISKDSAGDTVPVPEEAEVFEFMFSKDGKDYGKVWVTLDGLRQLVIYYGKEVADSPKNGSQDSNSFSQLTNVLKRFATNRQLSFERSDQSNLEADMAKREHTKRQEQVNEGYYPIGRTASGNNNIPAVTMRIQHTRPIEEGEQRYRNIAKIFVENQDGERILLPTTKPGLARTYVRHIAEGGKPNDERWNHLTSLCEEYQKMAGFVRATRNGQFNESAQSLVTEGINHYQKLRETLGKLSGKRGYNEYFESYAPALMEDEEQVDLSEMFMSASLDPRIESVMPILSKLSKNITETKKDMEEVIALGEWADSLMDSTIKSVDDSDDYVDPEEADYDSPEWQETERNAKSFMDSTKKREVAKAMHAILSKGKEQGLAEGGNDTVNALVSLRSTIKQIQTGKAEYPQGFASQLEVALYDAINALRDSQEQGAQDTVNELAELRAVAKQVQSGKMEFPQGYTGHLEWVLYDAIKQIEGSSQGMAEGENIQDINDPLDPNRMDNRNRPTKRNIQARLGHDERGDARVQAGQPRSTHARHKPQLPESAMDDKAIWNRYGHYNAQDLIAEFPNLSPKDAQTIVNYAEYGWTNVPNRQEYRDEVVKRIQQVKGTTSEPESVKPSKEFHRLFKRNHGIKPGFMEEQGVAEGIDPVLVRIKKLSGL